MHPSVASQRCDAATLRTEVRSDDSDEDVYVEVRHRLGNVGGAAVAYVADAVGGVADNRDVDDVAAGREPDVAAPSALRVSVRKRVSFARSLGL